MTPDDFHQEVAPSTAYQQDLQENGSAIALGKAFLLLDRVEICTLAQLEDSGERVVVNLNK
jgi:hypothetical protein